MTAISAAWRSYFVEWDRIQTDDRWDRGKYVWAEGCSGREKGLWGLGKVANWKWSPRTPGSKKEIKGIGGEVATELQER